MQFSQIKYGVGPIGVLTITGSTPFAAKEYCSLHIQSTQHYLIESNELLSNNHGLENRPHIFEPGIPHMW